MYRYHFLQIGSSIQMTSEWNFNCELGKFPGNVWRGREGSSIGSGVKVPLWVLLLGRGELTLSCSMWNEWVERKRERESVMARLPEKKTGQFFKSQMDQEKKSATNTGVARCMCACTLLLLLLLLPTIQKAKYNLAGTDFTERRRKNTKAASGKKNMEAFYFWQRSIEYYSIYCESTCLYSLP